MKYLKKIDRWEFILFLGAGLIILMTFISFFSRPSLPPVEVRITNITDSSLVVSWAAEKPTKGGIVISTQPNRFLRSLEFLFCEYFSFNCLVYPDGIVTPSRNSYVFLKDLEPETSYYYRIVSGGRFWKYDKERKILPSLKTTGPVESLSLPNPVFSWILLGDGESRVPGALVYLSLIGGENRDKVKSQPLTTFTDSEGIWLADLGNLRGLDLKEVVNLELNDLLYIEIWAPDGRKSAEFVEVYQGLDIDPIILR